MSIASEIQARLERWNEICRIPDGQIDATTVRSLGLYNGAQGIFVDVARTSKIDPAASRGITVSILHTGEHYPDDLSEDGLIYHYPVTKRKGHDRMEIAATKSAMRLKVPIFVILEGNKPSLRRVRLGWVVDYDDEASQFLVAFGETPPNAAEWQDSEPFQLFSSEISKTGSPRKQRLGQQQFRFEVLKKYGLKCFICSVETVSLLDAAHICGKKHKGSDHWQNGIVLCATHHRAFDNRLFFIDPTSAKVVLPDNMGHEKIGARQTAQSISGLRPHLEALNWRKDWTRSHKLWQQSPVQDDPEPIQ